MEGATHIWAGNGGNESASDEPVETDDNPEIGYEPAENDDVPDDETDDGLEASGEAAGEATGVTAGEAASQPAGPSNSLNLQGFEDEPATHIWADNGGEQGANDESEETDDDPEIGYEPAENDPDFEESTEAERDE
jgi:hypothetical protein